MSKAVDLRGKTLPFYTISLSSMNNSSVSVLQTEKVDGHSDEAPCSKSVPIKETMCHIPAKDDYPDGGLRAWLVVLGVRP